ncbi:MAG: hypothetical protein MI723_17580, partial [Caulobacterales bacterium]|nr:hypothetical protein [Caulobacterales bacterium]
MKLAHLNRVRKLGLLFSKSDRLWFAALFLSIAASAVIEMGTLALVQSFVAYVANPTLEQVNASLMRFLPLPESVRADSSQMMIWSSGAIFLVFMLKLVFFAAIFVFQAHVVTKQQVALKQRVFNANQMAPYSWHMQRTTSQLLRSITYDTTQALREFVMPLLDFVMAVVLTIAIVCVLVLFTPLIVLVGLAVTGLGLFAVVSLTHHRMKAAGALRRESVEESMKAVQQGFGALAEARVLGSERSFRQAHRNAIEREARAMRVQIAIGKVSPYAIETFAIGGLLSVGALITLTANSMEAALPIIALIAVATLRLKQTSAQIASSVNRISAALPHITSIVG